MQKNKIKKSLKSLHINLYCFIFVSVKNIKAMKIGTITKEQIRTNDRRMSRELELENSTGWTSKHKVHKSKKNYSRKKKHRNLDY
jgi:hypothetical protein